MLAFSLPDLVPLTALPLLVPGPVRIIGPRAIAPPKLRLKKTDGIVYLSSFRTCLSQVRIRSARFRPGRALSGSLPFRAEEIASSLRFPSGSSFFLYYSLFCFGVLAFFLISFFFF